jgi:hypothetical protein
MDDDYKYLNVSASVLLALCASCITALNLLHLSSHLNGHTACVTHLSGHTACVTHLSGHTACVTLAWTHYMCDT